MIPFQNNFNNTYFKIYENPYTTIIIFNTFCNCFSCNQGNQIIGNFTNASDISISLDRIGLDNSAVAIDKTEFKGGSFKFQLKEANKPGLYRITMGQQNLIFVLDGTESKVEFSGNYNELGSEKSV